MFCWLIVKPKQAIIPGIPQKIFGPSCKRDIPALSVTGYLIDVAAHHARLLAWKRWAGPIVFLQRNGLGINLMQIVNITTVFNIPCTTVAIRTTCVLTHTVISGCGTC